MQMPLRPPSSLWIVVVVACTLGFSWWDTALRSRHLLEVSGSYGVLVDAPAIDPSSPTGYESGRRSLVLPSGATDTSHWIMQTQQMLAESRLRVRTVTYDNAPDGREVHWTSPLRWWLGLLAWGDGLISSRPVGVAVERAALFAGPVMLTLAIPMLAWLLHGRFSAWAAGVTPIAMIATFPFYTDFMAGRADHHGMANLCGLLTVLTFLAGARTGRPGGSARRWFIASGISGGVGLWISTATQVPVLVGMGGGLLAAALILRKESAIPAWMRHPDLLRTWGRWGGGVSLASYAIEYLPGHLGLRLEVNHPLYALAWVGAGELLRFATVALRSGARSLPRPDRLNALAAVAAMTALPLTLVLTKGTSFTVADPFLWQLHSLYISEFQGMSRLIARQGLTGSAIILLLPLLAILLPLALFTRRTVPRSDHALLLLAVLPALLVWAMAWQQVRWLGLAFALTVPVVAISFQIVETHLIPAWKSLPRWCAVGVLLIFAPGMIAAINRTLASTEFTPGEIRSLAERDVAHWLRLRSGGHPVVVAGAPTATTRMIYWGGARGLGTLYWENNDGLKNAAELYAASSLAKAHELIRRSGVTHLVFFSWEALEVALAKLHRGLPEEASIPTDTFIAQLLGLPVPPLWLRPLPFILPGHPALAGAEVRLWEVVEPQTPARALANTVNHHLETGRPDLANRLAPLLARFPHELPVTIVHMNLATANRDSDAFAEALARLDAQMRPVNDLTLGDHVRLVSILALAQRFADARDQLGAALSKADPGTIRQLTPGELAELLALSNALGVPLAAPGLRDLAEDLVPPSRRP